MATDERAREAQRVLRLRGIFDEEAELYDRVRPGYPADAVDDLTQLAGIDDGARVLEIGAGTGRLTVELARRGCQITAVELGPRLAAVAMRRLAQFSNATVVTAAFEEWTLPPEPFDAVIAATSFHWLDPEVRVGRAADALRIGGALAVVSTHHVAGGTHSFFDDAQACYEQWDPATPPGLRLTSGDEFPAETEEIDVSGRFGEVAERRYSWDVTYTAPEYLDLLRTYSGHRALPPHDLQGLLGCIAALIEERYNGRITKRYLTRTVVAYRKA
jgi:SAM-dependent methyltransferase